MEEFDVNEMVKLGQKYWTEWNSRILERLGIQQNKEFYARKIDELWWKYAELEVYPDVMEVLTELKIKKIKTGIVTNGFEKDCKQILQTLDLTNYFDVIVGSDSCNKAKPDKAIFLYAINKLYVRPEEAIFVGDSVKSDYEGAKNAGLKPILINRKEKVVVNAEAITSLTDVLRYF